MISINELMRGIVLKSEHECNGVNYIGECQSGIEYQNQNIRLVCDNNYERKSNIKIRFLDKESLKREIAIIKYNQRKYQRVDFYFIVGEALSASISFVYDGENNHIDINSFGRNVVSFKLCIQDGKAYIECDGAKANDENTIGIEEYTTEVIFNRIRAAICDNNENDDFVKLIDNMFETVRPALILCLLDFNEKCAQYIDSLITYKKNVPVAEYGFAEILNIYSLEKQLDLLYGLMETEKPVAKK